MKYSGTPFDPELVRIFIEETVEMKKWHLNHKHQIRAY